MFIGIDFDSTIAKIDQPWLDKLNKKCGTCYLAENWLDWELSFLKPEHRQLFYSQLTPELYDSVLPYPHAPESIKRLATIDGVKLACVTSNPKHECEAFSRAKENWLKKYVPELSKSIIIADIKTGLGLDVLVDDAPKHIGKTEYISVLVKRPWNRQTRAAFEFEDWVDGQAILEKIIKSV